MPPPSLLILVLFQGTPDGLPGPQITFSLPLGFTEQTVDYIAN